MKKTRLRTGLIALVVVAMLAATLLWRQEAAHTKARQARVKPMPAAVAETQVKNQPDLSDNAGKSPLPPEMEDLRARAETGDHVAACRLASQLLLCTSAEHETSERVLEALRQFEQEAIEAGDLQEANSHARRLSDAVSLARDCAGIPDDASTLGYDYLRQSALAGNDDAVLLHASGNGMSTSMREGFSILRDARFDQWRSEAPVMLQSRLENGDPAALLALLRGYNGHSRLSWVLAPDPDRKLALTFLAELVFNQTGFYPPLVRPSPEQRAQARELAQRWHASYFEGKQYPLRPHLERLRAPTLGEYGEQRPVFNCSSMEGAP